MFRYKRLIGDALRSRKPDAQEREAMIAAVVINRWRPGLRPLRPHDRPGRALTGGTTPKAC